MFAVLGPAITFEVVGSPSNLDYTHAYTYSKHKVVEARPRLQWIGDDLAECELDVTFHVRYCHPLAQVTAIYAAADAHHALALVFSNGIHKGYWVITQVEEKPSQLADDGSIICVEMTLKLQEWVLGDEVDPKAPPKPTSPPPGLVSIGSLVPFGPVGVELPGGSGSGSGSIGTSVPFGPVGVELPTPGRVLGTYTSTMPLGLSPTYTYLSPGASSVSGVGIIAPAPTSSSSYTSVPPGAIVGSPS